jgi:uncharacterized protein (UPF0335 family)
MTDPETLAIQYQTHVRRLDNETARLTEEWARVIRLINAYLVGGDVGMLRQVIAVSEAHNETIAEWRDALADVHIDTGKLWDAVMENKPDGPRD